MQNCGWCRTGKASGSNPTRKSKINQMRADWLTVRRSSERLEPMLMCRQETEKAGKRLAAIPFTGAGGERGVVNV